MSKKKKEKVVIKTLCPLCWREEKVKVEGDLPCVECQEGMKKGFLVIGVDFQNSSSEPEMAKRTGHRWIISAEAAKELYKDESAAKGAGLLDLEEAKQLGLPVLKSTVVPKPVLEKGGESIEEKAELTLCGVCKKPIQSGELGGIDPKLGFMHKTCTPLKLI